MKKLAPVIILAITAVLLLIANLSLQRDVRAANTIKDRDYQLVTVRMQDGGEGLFVTDNRTGMTAVFSFDPASRTVVPRAVGAVGAAFGQ